MWRSMLRLVCGLALIFPLLTGAPVSAQAGAGPAAAAEEPKFTSKTQLVLVPVVVTGEHGEFVGGLGRDAFKIEEGKKAREATIFEEVKTFAPAAPARAATLAGRSNFTDSDVQNWRLTVVVLDMLNTGYLYLPGGKQHLVDFLSKILSDSLQRGEPTAMFGLGTNGLTLLHPFSSDTAVLVEALRHVQMDIGAHPIREPVVLPGQSAGMQQAVNETAQRISDFINEGPALRLVYRDLVWTTLDAMTQIAHAYSAIPGRKTMIWASGRLPFMIDDPDWFAHMGPQTTEKYDEAWRSLVAAEIAGYPVDLSGLDDRNSSAYVRFGPASRARDSLITLADATGGTACMKTTEVAECIARGVEDSHAYYLLGYYLPANDQKEGWRKLKVKVEATGAQVRARAGFYVPSPTKDTPEARHREIEEAMRSPVDFTGVRLNVREIPVSAGSKATAPGKSLHQFSVGVLGKSVSVDAGKSNAIDMTLVAVAFAHDGANAGHAELHMAAQLPPDRVEALRKSGIQGTPLLELAPGKYDIRFVVRDNLSGGIGSVVYPLQVK
jgi:VWFA-related protein